MATRTCSLWWSFFCCGGPGTPTRAKGRTLCRYLKFYLRSPFSCFFSSLFNQLLLVFLLPRPLPAYPKSQSNSEVNWRAECQPLRRLVVAYWTRMMRPLSFPALGAPTLPLQPILNFAFELGSPGSGSRCRKSTAIGACRTLSSPSTGRRSQILLRCGRFLDDEKGSSMRPPSFFLSIPASLASFLRSGCCILENPSCRTKHPFIHVSIRVVSVYLREAVKRAGKDRMELQ